MKRKWWILLAVLAIGIAAAVRVSAGALTAGSYNYIISGQDVELPVDILMVQGAVLVPQDLLTLIGLQAAAVGNQVAMSRGPVRAEMKIASDTAVVDGKPRILKSGPMRISGRLFVPADVLPYLGVQVDVEGKFVVVRDWAQGESTESKFAGEAEYQESLKAHTLQNILRGNSGAYGQVTITALTPDLLRDDRTAIPWGTRMKLLSLQKSRTLLLVTIQNNSLRTLSIDPTKLLLSDDTGRQYDYLKLEVPIDGSVTTAIAPGATRSAILAYDRATGGLSLYYEPNGDVLGKVAGQ